MNLFQIIILSVIEGITEFLPISSTGHLILAQDILQIPSSAFNTSFNITIQLGAILAVVVFYWRRVMASPLIWKRVLTAFIPTAIIGFLLYKVIKTYFLANSLIVVWSLFLGGLALIIFELWQKKRSRALVFDLATVNS